MANLNVNKVIYGGDVLIDLTGDSVSADKILKGITAHDKSGAKRSQVHVHSTAILPRILRLLQRFS